MAPVPAHRALGYALSREMIGVYLVVLAGLALLAVAEFLSGHHVVIARLASPLLRILGFVTANIGLVALLYKVVADATTDATADETSGA